MSLNYYDGTKLVPISGRVADLQADKTVYSNTTSGLSSTNVQGAIDEVTNTLSEVTEELSAVMKGTDAWSSSKTYAIGDCCILNNTIYSCIKAHSNVTPPNTTYWKTTSISDLTEDVLQITNTTKGWENASLDSNFTGSVQYKLIGNMMMVKGNIVPKTSTTTNIPTARAFTKAIPRTKNVFQYFKVRQASNGTWIDAFLHGSDGTLCILNTSLETQYGYTFAVVLQQDTN